MQKSASKSFDMKHRKTINFNINKYNEKVLEGKKQFSDEDLIRERAKNLKWRAIETLDQTLENFESTITQNGAKVLWAETAEEAANLVLQICKEKSCTTLVKSKSMATEEIHLNDLLEKNIVVKVKSGKNNNEIDLSEFNIKFPENGIFVSVEFLIIEENRYDIEVSFKDSKKKQIMSSYQPTIGTVPSPFNYLAGTL